MGNMPLWVFGYGSLMWKPGFAPVETSIARLDGYERAFCMWSIHHRGTKERPGLVLALRAEPSASCHGLALRVADNQRERVLADLRARELVSYAYREEWLDVALENGARVRALAYVVDPAHPQHAGALSPEEQARIILAARGGQGENREYLYNTAAHLRALGIEDTGLERLAQMVRRMDSQGVSGAPPLQ